jgi:hypothetical protein
MKIYKAVQKLLMGDTHTDRHTQTGDLISLYLFLESGLKWIRCVNILVALIANVFYFIGLSVSFRKIGNGVSVSRCACFWVSVSRTVHVRLIV